MAAGVQPAAQHRHARDLAQAGEQDRVQEEADEDRRHDVAQAGVHPLLALDACPPRRSAAFQVSALAPTDTRFASSASAHVSDFASVKTSATTPKVNLRDSGDHDRHQHRRDRHRLEHHARVRAQLLGQLGHGHELEAALAGGGEDPGQRRDGLRAVVARAGAVAVVQQQDRARLRGAWRSGRRSPRCPAGRCRRRCRSSRPPGSPAARRPAPRTGCESRAACGTAAPRGARPRLDLGLLGRAELVGDRLRPGEREQRVVVAVAGQLVALVHDPAGELGMGVHVAAQAEERAP